MGVESHKVSETHYVYKTKVSGMKEMIVKGKLVDHISTNEELKLELVRCQETGKLDYFMLSDLEKQ